MTRPGSETQQGFTKEELTRGCWVKIGQHGVHRVVQFSPSGLLNEQDLFCPLPFRGSNEYSWTGEWRLEQGGRKLIITVRSWQLEVWPEKRYNIHPGLQINTEDPNYRGSFKLIHAGFFPIIG